MKPSQSTPYDILRGASRVIEEDIKRRQAQQEADPSPDGRGEAGPGEDAGRPARRIRGPVGADDQLRLADGGPVKTVETHSNAPDGGDRERYVNGGPVNNEERTIEVPITMVPFMRMAQADWFPEGARRLIRLSTPAGAMTAATYSAVIPGLTEGDVVMQAVSRVP